MCHSKSSEVGLKGSPAGQIWHNLSNKRTMMVIDYKSFNEKGNPQVHSTSQERMKDVFITEEMIQLEKITILQFPVILIQAKIINGCCTLIIKLGFRTLLKDYGTFHNLWQRTPYSFSRVLQPSFIIRVRHWFCGLRKEQDFFSSLKFSLMLPEILLVVVASFIKHCLFFDKIQIIPGVGTI